jgi:hypothetical protein
VDLNKNMARDRDAHDHQARDVVRALTPDTPGPPGHPSLRQLGEAGFRVAETPATGAAVEHHAERCPACHQATLRIMAMAVAVASAAARVSVVLGVTVEPAAVLTAARN